MSTPPRDPRPTPPELHRARELAESFGADAARYHRTRPRYPDRLVDRILASSPGRDVLDVGIGTGVAAAPFRSAGCRVLGVEVDARMAQFARADGFEVEIDRFEQWPSGGRTFDTIIAGQTWHWIDPVAGAGRAAELLAPGGQLAVFWNLAAPPPELLDAFAAVYRRVAPDAPHATDGRRDAVAGYEPILAATVAGLRETGAFREPERIQLRWTRRYSSAEWLDQVPTFGGHSRLSAATLGELLAGIGAAIDAVGGRFTARYTTVAILARVTPATVSSRRGSRRDG